MGTETSYLGLRLPHPFVAGASPFGQHLDTVRRLEDGGCAALVLPSLFEEQMAASPVDRARSRHGYRGHDWTPVLAGLRTAGDYAFSPDGYVEHIRRVKQAVAIPVIASLNGTSPESWLTFSRLVEEAGADAIELNLYEVVSDLDEPAALVEARLAGIVAAVKRVVRIPVAVKVSPFFTAFGHMARAFEAAGADALVLFNRFYQPDIDIQRMRVAAHVELSTASELPLRLHWLAILYGRIRPALAVTGGIDQPEDAIKAILSGAEVVQMVSALLRYGSTHARAMRQGLDAWMEEHEIAAVADMRGEASLHGVAHPAALERAGYIRTLHSWGRETYGHHVDGSPTRTS